MYTNNRTKMTQITAPERNQITEPNRTQITAPKLTPKQNQNVPK